MLFEKNLINPDALMAGKVIKEERK